MRHPGKKIVQISFSVLTLQYGILSIPPVKIL